MDIKVLEYFLAVAKEKNFTKASYLLHVSQPAISKQIKLLENELGVELFKRSKEGISLTEQGIYLQTRAQEIIDLVDNTMNNISIDNELIGTINIGAGETYAMKNIMNVFNETFEKNKNITINIYSGNAEDIYEKLDKGVLDVGLLIDPVNRKMYDYIKLPYKDQWGLLVHKDNLLSSSKSINITKINDYPILVSKQLLLNRTFTNNLNINLEDLNIIGTYNLLYNAALAVNKDISVLCIDKIINTTNTNLRFIPFSPVIEVETYLVWLKNKKQSKITEYFLSKLNTIDE